jgi:hypothetical protein
MTFYFSGFVDFVGAHPHYALTAVFLLALSEAIPVIGTVVPGSTLIVGISALAAGANGTHGSFLLPQRWEPLPAMVYRSGLDSDTTGRFSSAVR